MTTKQMTRSARVLAVASLVVLSACADKEDRVDVLSPEARPEAQLSVKVSDLNAGVGDQITVAVTGSSETQLGAVQGYLRYDPARLRFAGQIADHEAVVVINESRADRGEIRLAAFHGVALSERIAKFVFEVRAPGYTSGVIFQPEVVGDLQQRELRPVVDRVVALDAQLPATKPVRWSYLDWAMYTDETLREEVSDIKTNITGLPVSGTLYGDATLNGIINVLDASDVSNTAVGNREVIIGTTTVDRVTAANVRPLAAGACLAGFTGTDCSARVINVLDASPISQEVVGTNVPVVGDPIPLPKSAYVSGDTVFLPAQTVTGTRTFDRDTMYVLQGILTVGIEAGAAGDLVVEAGTRIEGQNNSAIFITRNGRIHAIGTPTQPITMTCRLVAPATVRIAGCWGGLFIAGNAVINEQDAALAGVTAPAIPGRNPAGGQNQRRGEGGAVNYGGGNDADSSGVVRYVRLAYGGRDLGNNNELNNLTIGACGSGTVLDHIQVHAGEDDGLEFFGGRCNVKYLYATANDDDQFDYSFGYDGRAQFILLQHCRVAINDCDKQFEVDNTETASTYNATPRTNPQVYNVTSVGGSQGTGTSHIHYRRGAGGTIRNALLIGGSRAFTIDNTETCPAVSGLSWGTTMVMNPALVTQTVGQESNCLAATVAVGAQVDTATYVAQLKDPNNVLLPDFRPVGTGITSLVFSPTAPPGGGFFDTAATYFGAVRPVGGSSGELPWYAGWSMGWQSATTR